MALRDGQKVILAVESGYRESTESWATILRGLEIVALRAAPALALSPRGPELRRPLRRGLLTQPLTP